MNREHFCNDFAAGFASTPLPLLVLSGAMSGGEYFITQGRLVATNVEGVVVIPKRVDFLTRRAINS